MVLKITQPIFGQPTFWSTESDIFLQYSGRNNQIANPDRNEISAVIIANFNFENACLLSAKNNTNVQTSRNTSYFNAKSAGDFDSIGDALGDGLVNNGSLNRFPFVVDFANDYCELLSKTPGILPFPAVGIHFPNNVSQYVLCPTAKDYLTSIHMIIVGPCLINGIKFRVVAKIEHNIQANTWNFNTFFPWQDSRINRHNALDNFESIIKESWSEYKGISNDPHHISEFAAAENNYETMTVEDTNYDVKINFLNNFSDIASEYVKQVLSAEPIKQQIAIRLKINIANIAENFNKLYPGTDDWIKFSYEVLEGKYSNSNSPDETTFQIINDIRILFNLDDYATNNKDKLAEKMALILLKSANHAL